MHDSVMADVDTQDATVVAIQTTRSWSRRSTYHARMPWR